MERLARQDGQRDVNTPADAGEIVADTERVDGNGTRFDSGSILGQRSRTTEIQQPCRWLPEPGVGRVANGVPGRIFRLRSLGNAVVPQVVEVIGRAIRRAHIVCGACPGEHFGSAINSIQHLHGGEYAQMPKRHFTMQETLGAIWQILKL